MKKTAITCLLTVSMLGGVSSVAMADPVTTNSTAKANVEASKANVANQQKAYQDAQAQLASAQTNLEQISNEISNLTRQINENNIQIANNEKQLKIFTAEYQKDLQLEAARIKSIYQNNDNTGFLSILLTSKNFGQMISRLYALNKLMQLDHEATEKTLAAKNSMDATQKKLNDLKASNEAKLSALNTKKASAEDLLTKMQGNVAYQQQKLEQAKATAEASIQLLQNANTESEVDNAIKALHHIADTTDDANIKSQINNAINNNQNKINKIKEHNSVKPVVPTPSAPSPNVNPNTVKPSTPAPVPSNGSVTGQDIVSYAMNFLGCPYVWGALGPNAFDCSGLTHYVYAHFGIQIGDDTYSQIDEGTPVSKNDLQAGDLIFWGNPAAPYHVAIYIGGGEYIQAPKPGSNVDISSWNFQNISAARRIL